MRSTSALVALSVISAAVAIVVGACVGDDASTTANNVPDSASTSDAPGGDGSPGPVGTVPSEDASKDAPAADTNVPAFSPSELGPSLVTWLDASRSVTADASSLVSSWGDVSGSGNTALATGAERPTRTAAALNGHDIVTFNGTSTYLTINDSTSLHWGTGDYAVFVVARYSNTPALAPNGSAAFWFKTVGSLSETLGVVFFANDTSTAVLTTSVAPTAFRNVKGTHPFNDGVWRIYATRRVTDTLEIRVNGAVEATLTAATIATANVDATGQPAFIGGENVSGTPYVLMVGSIAEVIAVKGLLSNEKLTKLEGFLKTRYAL